MSLVEAQPEERKLKFVLPPDVKFGYHKNYHSNEMEISNDGLEARINPAERLPEGVVYSERPVRGHVEFEVEIISYGTFSWAGSLKLGVMLHKSQTSLWEVAEEVALPRYTPLAANHCVWGSKMVYDKITSMKEMPYSRNLNELLKGDRVGLLITSDGELHFLINGEPQGRATYDIYGSGYDVYITVNHWGKCKATRITRANETDITPQLLLEKGMEEGYVSLSNFKIVICGPPCIGKTAFKTLLLNKPPPLKHSSTPIAARPIQAIERIAAKEKGWEEVSEEDILEMLWDSICSTESDDAICSTDSDDAVTAATPSTQQLDEEDTETDSMVPTATTKGDVSNADSSHVTGADTISQKPIRDADYYTENILQIVTSRKEGKMLHKAKWIHLLDSGGQPQFIDLLRMFVRGNSLYIIVMKVTESLHDKPLFTYSINGEPVSAPREMTMTNLQIIESFVRSVVAASRDNSNPVFVIVATHIDKLSLESLDKALKDKNRELQEHLEEFIKQFIFYNRNSKELIFPINNLCMNNREVLATEICNCIMSHSNIISFTADIPVRWYIYDIKMKEEASKETHGMISLQSCYTVGSKLGMNESEVKQCLIYLDSMRLCIYYPNLLPHVVFTNPQFLIDSLSNIVCVSFVDDLRQILPKGVSLSDETVMSLKRDGVFDELLLDNLGLTFLPTLFSKTDLLSLLELFRIISPIKAMIKDAPCQYFIPVLLPAETITEKQKRIYSASVEPLIVTLKDNKLLLQGLFPALIVSLLNRLEEPCFFIDSRSPDFPNQLRHAVKLYSEDLFGSVFLCDEYSSIEVYFTGPPQNCCLLRKVILEGLSATAEVLGYDEKSSAVSALARCNRKHILPVNDTKSHPITISYNVVPPAIGCSIETSLQTVALNDERQSCWLIGPTDSIPKSSNLPADGTAVLNQSHAPIILQALRKIVFEWELLGLYLGIENYVLQEIKYNCRDQVQVCRKDMISYWIKTKSATRDGLIIALEKVKRNDVAADVKSIPDV